MATRTVQQMRDRITKLEEQVAELKCCEATAERRRAKIQSLTRILRAETRLREAMSQLAFAPKQDAKRLAEVKRATSILDEVNKEISEPEAPQP